VLHHFLHITAILSHRQMVPRRIILHIIYIHSGGVKSWEWQVAGKWLVASGNSGVGTQESELGSRESGVRSQGQESGVRSRSRESGVGSQESGVRSRESGVRSQSQDGSRESFE
jgi:hypothetical protein